MKVNFKWVIPIALCYVSVGFFMYMAYRVPEVALACALSSIAVVLLAMTVVIGWDTEVTKKG